MRRISATGALLLAVAGSLACDPSPPAPVSSEADQPVGLQSFEQRRCEAGVQPLALPATDLTCQIEGSGSEGRNETLTWDARARRLAVRLGTMPWLEFDFDESGRLVARRGISSPVFEHRYRYDARGQRAALEADGQSGTYENRYDPTGRLIAQNFRGDHRADSVYGYDPQGRLETMDYSQPLSDGSVHRDRKTFTYDRGCQVSGSQWSDPPGSVPLVIRDTWKYTYDPEGRLVLAERDGGGFGRQSPDGKVDVRQRWTYGPDGRLTTFERDGTDSMDHAFVDGEPEEKLKLAPGCGPFTELYRDELFMPLF